jgi:hypothetical protein
MEGQFEISREKGQFFWLTTLFCTIVRGQGQQKINFKNKNQIFENFFLHGEKEKLKNIP